MPSMRRRVLALFALPLAAAVAAGSCSVAPPQPPAEIGTVQQPRMLTDRAVMSDGYELPYRTWAPESAPRAVVLALHGFNDYHNAFAGVGPEFATRGILTYAYDQRGFGATEQRGHWAGAERMVADARTMLRLLRDKHPGVPVYLMGESMGGAVGLATVASGADGLVDGVVLVAPAVWARRTMPWYQRAALSVARVVAPGWRPTGRGLGKVASDNREMLLAMGRDPMVIKGTRIDTVAGLADLMDLALDSAPRLNTPALVLYGERDEIVPKRPTCSMLATLPDRQRTDWRLALYPQGYHMLTRDLQGQVVVGDIAQWILDPSAPLPSGHEAAQSDWNSKICQAQEA